MSKLLPKNVVSSLFSDEQRKNALHSGYLPYRPETGYAGALAPRPAFRLTQEEEGALAMVPAVIQQSIRGQLARFATYFEGYTPFDVPVWEESAKGGEVEIGRSSEWKRGGWSGIPGYGSGRRPALSVRPEYDGVDFVTDETRGSRFTGRGDYNWSAKSHLVAVISDAKNEELKAAFAWGSWNPWAALAAQVATRLRAENAAWEAAWAELDRWAHRRQMAHQQEQEEASRLHRARLVPHPENTKGAENCFAAGESPPSPPVRNFRRKLLRELEVLRTLPVFAGRIPRGLDVVEKQQLYAWADGLLGVWAPTRNLVAVRRTEPELARLILIHELCHVVLGVGHAEHHEDEETGEVWSTSHSAEFRALFAAACAQRYPDGTPECVSVLA